VPDAKGPGEGDDSEVLSFSMTDRDDDLPIDDEPHLTPSDPDAGFDGWLDGEEQDPYRDLAEEPDAAAEVADWLAFARGEDQEDATAGPKAEPEDDATGIEDQAVEEEVGEGEWVEEEPESDEESAPDEERLEIESPPIVTAEIPSVDDEVEDTSEFDLPVPDATGDIPLAAMAIEDTGDVPVVDVSLPDDLDAVVEIEAVGSPIEEQEPPDIDSFTAEDYISAATQEHADLAAAVAAADQDRAEPVAVSASIPGLESGVVGFADVVGEEEAVEEATPEEPSNLLLRVGTAAALIVALALSLLWRPALIVFVLAAFIVAAGEFYSALIHHRYKPMTLFGFLGIAGAGLGTAAFGVVAIPVAMALMATFLLLFNAVSPRRDRPADNFALTVLVAAWIGGLGAFAFDIIASDDYQVLVISLVATIALVDIASFFVGRSIGRRPLAPVVSPKKTVEGLVAGVLTGLAVGAAIGYLVDSIDLPAGLLLGGVVAVFAPIGDLAVSVVKRSLDMKDMGSILPGHGGLLDRIDAVITVVPAAWVVLTWLALI
jgi:phosphatidate cytidylyltransferase